MTPSREALEALGQLPDDEIDIAAAALQLARIDLPDADPAPVQAHLSDIARAAALGAFDADAPEQQAGALAELLAGQFGYQGDARTYDSPDNANLIRVVQRRRGLPVALGILWIHAARTAGWEAHGVNFPGHFLVGLGSGRRRVMLDVFAGGVVLDASALRTLLVNFEGPDAQLRAEILAPMDDRDVLLRLQNNIKLRRLRSGDFAAARTCNADMLLFAPATAALWRDEALLAERLEEPAAALAAWQRFLELVPTGAEAVVARDAVRQLRSRLH
jgi:regulator of sirC expression with transglutaminase-like and TPR domain